MLNNRIFIVCVLVLSIHSTPGDLDLTFGHDKTGISLTRIGRYNNLSQLVLYEDYYYSVGEVEIKTVNCGIGRYTLDGILDPEFNKIGYQRVLVANKTTLSSVVVQSNGYAVIGGSAISDQSDFLLARFDTSGGVDTKFGKDGNTTTRVGSGAAINGLILQADDYILAAGCAIVDQVAQFIIARYTPDGLLDDNFGNRGIVCTTIGKQSSAEAIIVQDDGKIIVGGYGTLTSSEQFTLARYNPDGSLDTSFGTKGIVNTSIGNISHIQTMALQNDGKIVVGGYTNSLNLNDFALARYTQDGILDESFNGSGIVITESDYDSMIFSMAIQTDGKIIAGGYNYGAINTTFSLTRYNIDGSLDTSFGSSGKVFTTIGNNAQIESLILQSDGKIIAGGFSDNNIAIARYLAD